MKTCNIQGNVKEYKTDHDFLTFVRELMVNATIKPADGTAAITHFMQGHKSVIVDGVPLMELAEVPDGE